MRGLIGCEFSGVMRGAFRPRGHDAWSCDLLPTEADPKYHIQDDILKVLASRTWRRFDLFIAHPREEAEANARDLMWRWMAVRDTRAVESADPVNYRWAGGKLEAV